MKMVARSVIKIKILKFIPSPTKERLQVHNECKFESLFSVNIIALLIPTDNYGLFNISECFLYANVDVFLVVIKISVTFVCQKGFNYNFILITRF